MGPIESSMREAAFLTKLRLEGPKPKDRVELLEDEIRDLRRQLLVLTSQLRTVRTATKETGERAAVNRIIDMVCEGEGVSRLELVSKRRTVSIILPRHICFYLAATQTIASMACIGDIFNKADHTTIMYGRDKIKELRKTDSELDCKLCYYESLI